MTDFEQHVFIGSSQGHQWVHHGDNSAIMERMENDSIDLVVTSPPYDNLRAYQGYSFDFSTVAKQIARILKPGGVCVWVVGDSIIKGSESLTSFKQAIYFVEQCKLNLHDTMIYQKSAVAFPMSTRYNQVFEYTFIFSKGKPKTFNGIKDVKNKHAGKSTIVTERGSDGSTLSKGYASIKEYSLRGNVWQISNGARGLHSQHPATFPLQLALDHIITWSNKGDSVLDPFAGSGTSLVAAKQLERLYLGVECSVEYVKLCRSRLTLNR